MADFEMGVKRGSKHMSIGNEYSLQAVKNFLTGKKKKQTQGFFPLLNNFSKTDSY